jgi:hypothetical protein
MGVTILEDYALNLGSALALGIALLPMHWSGSDHAKQNFYRLLYRTLGCLMVGLPILAFVLTFVASIIVAGSAAGSAQVTHGKRTDSAANFFKRAAAVKAGVSFGWGEHTTIRIIETQTMFIRHTATELQRRTAEKNATIYYARLSPVKKANLKAKKIRYILIPTVKSEETSPKAKEVRMTWDTQSESLVDKYVYEFENPPAAGTVAMVGGRTAEYTGQQ